jgi:GNAT superfamily N-acetyltransferase
VTPAEPEHETAGPASVRGSEHGRPEDGADADGAASPSLDGLRPITDADAAGVIELVASAYAEHPGCVLDLGGVDHDLCAPGTEAARRAGPWWVVERDARVVASVGAGALRPDGLVELKRLYLAPHVRGQGLASALVRLVERHAATVGAHSVELWSDTRFRDAHRRYERLGYERTGEQRDLDDPSHTTEYRFVRRLR